jgi:hypothetical protein
MTTMLTYGEKRRLFSRLFAGLILWAVEQGYEVAIDDVKCRDGHRKNSLHYIGLAGDLNLYRDGKYLWRTPDHLPLGDKWKSMHPLCCWGGDFGDGNHYSIAHEGRK